MSAFFSTARSASPPLLQIMLDRFGNYIVQRVIDTCSGTEKEEVKRLLGLALPKLQLPGHQSSPKAVSGALRLESTSFQPLPRSLG